MARDILIKDDKVLAQEWIPLSHALFCLDCQGIYRIQTAAIVHTGAGAGPARPTRAGVRNAS